MSTQEAINSDCDVMAKMSMLRINIMKGKQRLRNSGKIEDKTEEPQPSNRNDKLSYFLRKVEDRMVGLIDAQEVIIPSKKMPFADQPQQESKNISLRLKQIQDSKQKMESRLRQVSEQQRDLKNQQRSIQQSRLRTQSPLQSKPRSELSQKDLSLLRKLKGEQKRFEKSLEEKTREHEERVQALKKEEQALREKQMKEETEARKVEIAQKLELLKQQRAERDKKYQEEKKKMAELKARKKMHQELEKRQREADRQQVESRVAAMEERLKQREIDLQAIRRHEEKYRELKAQQQVEREKRKGELLQMAREKRIHVEKSKYYTLVLNENKRNKEEQSQRERQRFQLVEAARSYAYSAMREHAPKVKTREEEQEQHKLEALSFQEQKHVGNSYFEFMKKIPKKKREKMAEAESSQTTETPKPLRTQSTKYRDYLSERRHISDKMSRTRESRVRERGVMKEVEQACKLAGSKEREEGLERIKQLASRLEVARGGEDHQMIGKINAKLRILETLTK